MSQRRRGQKRRNEHDVLELVGGQRVAQHGGFDRVGPRHPDGGQLQAGVRRAFAGTQDRRDDLIGRGDGCRAVGRDDVELVVFDQSAVGIFALYQDHLHGSGRHRDAEHDIQS